MNARKQAIYRSVGIKALFLSLVFFCAANLWISFFENTGNATAQSVTNLKISHASTPSIKLISSADAWSIWSQTTTGTSLSANSLGFYNHSTGGTRLVITPSGNVGIGTTTPGALLDVIGTAQMTGFQLPTGAASGYVLTSDASGVATWQPAAGGADGDWTISGNNLFSAVTGNVGIGVPIPTKKLDVAGTVNATAFIGDGSGLTNLPAVPADWNTLTNVPPGFSDDTDDVNDADADPNNELQDLSGVLTQGNDAGGASITNLNTVTATAFVGDGSGLTNISTSDLAAGTYSNAYTFDNASNSFTGDGSGLTGVTATDATKVAKVGDTMTGTLTLNPVSGNALVTSAGNVGIGTATPGATLETVGEIQASGSVNGFTSVDRVDGTNKMIMYLNDGLLRFDDYGAGARMTINRTSGNVGIGTTTPSQKLDVAGTVNATAFTGDGSGLTGIIATDATKVAKVGDTMTGTLTLNPASGNALVTSAGNVGIGTATPTSQFANTATNNIDASGFGVNLASGITWSASGAGYVMTLNSNSTGANQRGLFIDLADTGSDDWLINAESAGASRFLVRADGNVGIGTATPTEKLDVAGTVNATAFTGDGSGLTGIIATDATKVAKVGDTMTGTLTLNPASGNALVTSTGNVGIGTSTPTSQFANTATNNIDADGVGVSASGITWSASGAGYVMTLNNPSLGADRRGLFIDLADTGNDDWLINAESAGAPRFLVTSGGNVGIGTATPGFTLEVNGTAGKPGGGSWSVASDSRLKDLNGAFTRGLEALTRLDPIIYQYKKNNPLGLPSDREYVGFIAQDVEAVIPEAVEKDEEGYLHLNNDPIIWTMLNAIKELRAELAEKTAALNQTQARLDDLTTAVARLASPLHYQPDATETSTLAGDKK